MKRFLTLSVVFFMIIGIALPILPIVAFAENTSDETQDEIEENAYDIRETQSVSFSCHFDSATYSINLDGTVNHDVLIKYRDYTIEIYAIPLGENVEKIVFDPNISAIAETPIAVRFQFSKKIESIVEKYYSYCVALRSQNGERILATDPRYAEVASSFEFDGAVRSGYKGIESELISSASNAGAGSVVIPIFLNKLISEASSGYVYQINDENIYFEKNYIEDLDAKIRTATSSGARTYFRVLVDGNGGGISIRYDETSSDVRYYMPAVYDEKTLTRIEAAISFLTKRYEDIQSGKVNGMIVGSRIDDISFNYIKAENDTHYTDMYALYTMLIANSARKIRSDMEIVIPLSDKNIFNSNTNESMLETLVKKFDHSLSSGLNFSVMIEGSASPIAISNGKFSFVDTADMLYVRNIELFDEYFSRLEQTFKSAPISFSFAWSVPTEVKANELCAAYAYSYLKLAACEKLSSFVISLVDSEARGDHSKFGDIKNVFEYIDTAERNTVLLNIIDMFEGDSWYESFGEKLPESPFLRKAMNVSVLNAVPSEVRGSFSYFDFSTSVSLNNWYRGISCGYMRLDHGSKAAALRADMTASAFGEYSELLCLYDYPESFIYTPYLAFRCKVENDTANDSLFEIVISGGQGAERLSASKTVHLGEETVIVLDISGYVNGLTDSWKISVRSLDGKAEKFSLNIYDIVGYSTEYESEELATKIEEERLRIRNQSKTPDDDSSGSVVAVIIIIAILVISLGIGIFICIRPSDSDADSDNEEDPKKE